MFQKFWALSLFLLLKQGFGLSTVLGALEGIYGAYGQSMKSTS